MHTHKYQWNTVTYSCLIYNSRIPWNSTINTDVTKSRMILPHSIYTHKVQLTTAPARDTFLEQVERVLISLKYFRKSFSINDKFYTKSYFDPYRKPKYGWICSCCKTSFDKHIWMECQDEGCLSASITFMMCELIARRKPLRAHCPFIDTLF